MENSFKTDWSQSYACRHSDRPCSQQTCWLGMGVIPLSRSKGHKNHQFQHHLTVLHFLYQLVASPHCSHTLWMMFTLSVLRLHVFIASSFGSVVEVLCIILYRTHLPKTLFSYFVFTFYLILHIIYIAFWTQHIR